MTTPVDTWVMPTPEALHALAARGPIVEIGAGTGYWAHLLRQMGVEVDAYDVWLPGDSPDNGWPHEKLWPPVMRGDASIAGLPKYRDWTLFLCWPPSLGLSDEALPAFTGPRVIYVGEPAGGGTGSRRFHELLRQWLLVQEIALAPQPNVSLYAYERK